MDGDASSWSSPEKGRLRGMAGVGSGTGGGGLKENGES